MTDRKPNFISKPEVTIIVVSDFEAGEKDWHDEVAMAQHLAAQDAGIAFDVVFVESSANIGKPPPPALYEALPDTRIMYEDAEQSATLKDLGVAACTTPLVAVFEADAVPESDWLSILYKAAQDHPEYAVYSGRTHYGAETGWQRVLNLLGRSFDDLGESGETDMISNNAALYRTQLLKQFPYPDAPTPFLSSQLRNRQIVAAGHKCFSDRNALSRHAIGGLGFVWDVGKHSGYSSYVYHGGRGKRDIPRIAAKRLGNDWHNTRRLGSAYLKPSDWPLFAVMFAAKRIPETVGIAKAASKSDHFEGSAYR